MRVFCATTASQAKLALNKNTPINILENVIFAKLIASHTFPFYCRIANVVNKVLSVQMGTVACDSLADAEDADLLQFAVSPTEVKK